MRRTNSACSSWTAAGELGVRELPTLSDPLGDGPLAVERTTGGLRFASVGDPNSSWPIERLVALR